MEVTQFAATLGEVCLADWWSILCVFRNHFVFLSSFDGIMPRNLQEQLLVHIVRLSAEGYSQWEVARMLGVSQGCVSKILRRNKDTGPWFNRKMSSYQYRKSHYGDKTILRPPYLPNGISYTGKMASLYWIRALGPVSISAKTSFRKISWSLEATRLVL